MQPLTDAACCVCKQTGCVRATLLCWPHVQVIGLALMCCTAGFFFAWSAGKCIPKNPDWGEEYGVRFQWVAPACLGLAALQALVC